MNTLAKSNDPADVSPASFQGAFTIPVCLNPNRAAPSSKGNGWPIMNSADKNYPCSCGNSTTDQTVDFYNQITFIDEDFKVVCLNHSAMRLTADIDNPVAVVEAGANTFRAQVG